jgi:RHS repeat-associated protein
LDKHEKFVYDGYKLIEVLNGASSDAITKKFVWSGDTLLSVNDMNVSATYYYLHDANKNVSELLDSSGNIMAHYEYSPFGKQTVASGSYTDNPFRFSTEYYEQETGLVYYNFRYYSPELGRWLNRDPIGEEGGYNLYGMLDNDAVNGRDYLGFEDFRIYETIRPSLPNPEEYRRAREKEFNDAVDQKLYDRKIAKEKLYYEYLEKCFTRCDKKSSPCEKNCCKKRCRKGAKEWVKGQHGSDNEDFLDILKAGGDNYPDKYKDYWGNAIYDNNPDVHVGGYADFAFWGGAGVNGQLNFNLLSSDFSLSGGFHGNIGYGASAGGYGGVSWGNPNSNGIVPGGGGGAGLRGPIGGAYTNYGGRSSLDISAGAGFMAGTQVGISGTIGAE